MEQESYYDYATMAFERSMYFLRLIVLHRAVLVGRWSVSNVASAASVVEAARAKMKRIMDAVHRLFFVLQWIRGHGEVALLYAEDLTVYVCRRHRFTPAHCRRINDIRSQDCYPWFGHNPHSLGRLLRHLRVPESFTHNRAGTCSEGRNASLCTYNT
jgi:hypothetical protein